MIKKLILLLSVASIVSYLLFFRHPDPNVAFVSYEVDAQKQDLKFYWQDDKGQVFKSINNLKIWLDSHGKELVFAMNGGMFKPDNSPQGLFIQECKTITPLDTSTASGNFYVKPNGVFYITDDHKGAICKTEAFFDKGKIQYATQSGPMLLINGQMHPAFKQGSANVNIRNGVGILPNGNIIFAMSKKKINFYDFALFFKKLNCQNALYLDGFVSKTYLPEKNWTQTDGNFGVIIGVTSRP